MARLRLFTTVFVLALWVLVACGSDQSDQQEEPRESEPPNRGQIGSTSATPTAVAPTDPGAAAERTLGADATWRDAFEIFADSAQTCIRDELGQDKLESVMGRRLLDTGSGPWEVSIFQCLEPDVARSLLFFVVSEGARQAGIKVSDEIEGCWTQVISTVDAAEMVAAEPAEAKEFNEQIVSCLETSTEPWPLTSEGGLTGLLRLIPQAETFSAFVSYNDYVKAREANGIEVPAEGASDEDLSTYIRELTLAGVAPGPWISGFSGPYAVAQLEQRTYLGFGVGDVEESILAGEPPHVLEAATGGIDPGATDRSLAACAECPEPEIHEHLGVRFYSWGEDFRPDLARRLQPPAYDELGRGGRIAVLDALAFRTLATEGMRSLIATYRDVRDSLANDPDLALAAGLLEDLEAYSAILLGDVEMFGPGCVGCDDVMRLVLQAAAEHSLDEYSALGAGVGRDTDGFFTILVFVYANEEDASRNVGVFKERWNTGMAMVSNQPWTEHFPQGEVWNDGTALIAKLRTDVATIWLSMVFASDSLLWHK